MKKIYFIIIAVLFASHIYGQQNDYLSILNRMPPVPDNVLATNKEKEIYNDKIMAILDLVTDYQSKFENMEEKQYSAADFDKMEVVLKEYESIYDSHIVNVHVNMVDKWFKLVEKNKELTGALDKVNEPYYEQIRLIISKPWNAENEKLNRSLRKKIYDSKLVLYTKMRKEMSAFYKETLDELKKVTPNVNKLDSLSLNVIKLKGSGVGPTLLRDYVKLLYDNFGAFIYNLGPFEEYYKDRENMDHILIGFPGQQE